MRASARPRELGADVVVIARSRCRRREHVEITKLLEGGQAATQRVADLRAGAAVEELQVIRDGVCEAAGEAIGLVRRRRRSPFETRRVARGRAEIRDGKAFDGEAGADVVVGARIPVKLIGAGVIRHDQQPEVASRAQCAL